VYFALHKIFYPVGRRCNSTFYAVTWCLDGEQQLKTLQNTVYHGLILQKVLLMIKTITKQSRNNTTHMLLSLFPLRTQCNETFSVFMHRNTEAFHWKILVKGLLISELMLLRDHVLHHMITTICVTRVVKHITMVGNTIFKILQLGSSKMFAVWIVIG